MSDTIEIDGREYAWRVEQDDISVFDEQGEGVWCGRLEWARRGDTERPAGFDGNAERIDRALSGRGMTDAGHALWWQPEPDVKRSDREMFARMRQSVINVLEHGYYIMVVEGPDGETTSLGGIESSDYAYYETEAEALADELHTAWQAEQANAAWALNHEIVTVGR